ncbi:hypothetical protein [Carnobacterium inhibens]|uniref:hypothetical protein n=1 Tax=Carnobacterium inhibens TaxID=147709 RepID=UPI000550E19C|nr:hypothetical protein [Carnobacterium inhibens]MCM3512578.1 hypothetical protein [Carnobacterium inhibens]
MKKLSMTLTMLTSLFILTGCNTTNEKAEAPTQSSVSQSDTSSSSSSQESAESTSSTTNSEEQSDTSNSSSMEESEESTSSTSENVINSEEEAFIFIKEETGIEADNTDIVYEVLESDDDSYTLKLISQSLQEQGGSGTAGIYKVYKDGTYEIVA